MRRATASTSPASSTPTAAIAWHDFASFLVAYGRASSVFRTRDDFRALAFDYFTSIAAEGAIYGEIFIAPDIAADGGVAYDDYVGGLADGHRARPRRRPASSAG